MRRRSPDNAVGLLPDYSHSRGDASLPRKPPDTVGEVGSGGAGGEARGAGGGARDRPEPGREPLEVDGGRGGHVLQMGFGQPAVAAAAQPEGAHALRDRPLNPGPPGVTAPALLRREPLARRPGALKSTRRAKAARIGSGTEVQQLFPAEISRRTCPPVDGGWSEEQ